MRRNHHAHIQNFRAELEARDICMNSIYALRHLVKAIDAKDSDALEAALTQAKVALNKLDHSTR